MQTARALLLVGCVLVLSLAAFAQESDKLSVPNAPSALRVAEDPAASLPRVPLAVEPIVARPPAIAPAPQPKPKVLDKKFFFWTGLAVLATVADVELTQRCLHHHTCVELNPTLPHGHAAMYAANIPVTGALFYWSYRRKAKGQRLWWLPTLVDAAPHVGGAIDNTRFK